MNEYEGVDIMDAVKGIYASAEPNWANGPVNDSAIIHWDDAVIVLTNGWLSEDYEMGVYTEAQWQQEEDGGVMAFFKELGTVVETLEWLTENHEVGVTGFAAWSQHWLTDICEDCTDSYDLASPAR